MEMKENNCHPPREKGHCNDDAKMQETRVFPAPESMCKSEILDPLGIAHDSCQHQVNESSVASTTDLDQNLNDEHGVQEVCRNLRVGGTITAEDIERNICVTEEKGRVQIKTTTRGEEVKNEPTTQYQHSSSGGTEFRVTDLGPVEFTSIKAMFHGFLKACITEENLEEVIASAEVFDKLLQNYLNVTAKTNDLEDSHKAASVNGEQQEHLDVSLTDVAIPETIEERHDYCLRESVMQKKTQNVKPEQRLSTALQEADSLHRGKGFSLTMGHGCDIQQKSTICGFNGLKPFALNDEGNKEGTSEETAGDLNFTTTQSRGGGNNKDVKLSCNSIPLSTAKDQESLKFLLERGRYFIDIAKDTITAENVTPIEIDDSQHGRTTENIDTSIIDSDRGEVEPSTGSPFEKTMDASSMIGHEAAAASDDECNSIASSNTEIYEEGDCQDIEIHEEETQEPLIKRHVDNLAALADVPFQFPSEVKSNKTGEKTIEEFVLSVNHCTASVDQLLDNSGHGETNNLPIQLEDSQIQKVLSLIMVSGRSAETTSGSQMRSCSKSKLQRSSDNLHNKVLSESSVAIVGESRFTNSTRTKSNQNESKQYSSNVMKQKRISVAAGIVYEDEVSSPEVSQCSTTTQTFLPFIHSEEAREVPSSSSRRGITNPGTSYSFWSHVDPLVILKLPPGTTLVSDQGIFATKDTEKPFACGYCGENYKKKETVLSHIIQQHDEKSRFSCEFCGKRFGDQYHLSRHLATHSPDKPFSCHVCGMCFRLKTDLCYHKLRHPKESSTYDFVSHSKVHSEDSYREDVVCNICKMVFKLPSALKQHMMIHFTEKSFSYEEVVSSTESSQMLLSSEHSEVAREVPSSRLGISSSGTSSSVWNHVDPLVRSKLSPGSTLRGNRGVFHTKDKEKPFACGYCGKAFKRKKCVYGHMKMRHYEKRYSCEFCGKRYALPCYLAQHVSVHTQEKPFTCDQCGKRFRLEGGLRNHKYTHSEERLFHCKKCNKSFKTSNNLARHSESHKKDEQREAVTCNICKIVSVTPYSLKQHMMIHTGEKPFKCSLCDKHFRLKSQLGYHLNTHNGKKSRADKQCTVCGKTVSGCYLQTHMRMHTGEKPFECSICKKRFPKKINLEGHMRSHTGEKPFACGGCDKHFALYSNMITHKSKCTTLSENVD